MSKISVHIINTPIDGFNPKPPKYSGNGSEIKFEGTIRPNEEDQPINGIHFEAYEKMALKVMKELLDQLDQEFGFLAAEVIHRIGDVLVGESAIRVTIWSEHRAEGFQVCTGFMDRLKQEVPIWKVRTF